MNVGIYDNETIGEVSAQAFQLYQQGPIEALIVMKNIGSNDIVYIFQQYTAGAWANLGVLGTVFNDTLEADAEVQVQISVASAKVRLLASASGGSTLSFGVLQPMTRTSGGALPLINL